MDDEPDNILGPDGSRWQRYEHFDTPQWVKCGHGEAVTIPDDLSQARIDPSVTLPELIAVLQAELRFRLALDMGAS